MRIVHQHIEHREDKGEDQRSAVGVFGVHDGVALDVRGNLGLVEQEKIQPVQPPAHMTVKEKHQKEKDKGQDVARFHAGGLHQRPGGKKTLEKVAKQLEIYLFVHGGLHFCIDIYSIE